MAARPNQWALGHCSDRRLKMNVQRIGTSPEKVPIYRWQYKDTRATVDYDLGAIYEGTMAQDLLEMGRGDAVTTGEDGYYRVDYSKLDVPMKKVGDIAA